MIIIYVAISLLIIAFGSGYFFARKVVYPQKISFEKTRINEIENNPVMVERFDQWDKKEFEIESPYGYLLKGYYIPASDSNKTIILNHGISYSLYGMVKYMDIFKRIGFNILAYDLRNHGRSGGFDTSYGLYEKEDLRKCVDWALEQLPDGGFIGTMGESMGAAIAIQHAAIDPRISFVIADCPFSDLYEMIQYREKVEYHLPSFPFIQLANFFCKQINGLEFSKVSPIRDVKNFETATLFIHGLEDRYIPPYMSQTLFNEKTNGLRKIHLMANARHVGSFEADPVTYEKVINDFLSLVK